MVSLKVYMGRLHCRRMQDLPIEHTARITPEQRPLLIDYNDNDLDGTQALLAKFKGRSNCVRRCHVRMASICAARRRTRLPRR